MAEARRYKQMLGGSMRQSGIVAAGARYGLQHNVARLAEDHANARFLAEGLAELPGVEIDPTTVETNIVIFDVPDAKGLHDKLVERGVEVSLLEGRVRAVTHLDVDRTGVEKALAAVKDAL
jgi:threonine aldolase